MAKKILAMLFAGILAVGALSACSSSDSTSSSEAESSEAVVEEETSSEASEEETAADQLATIKTNGYFTIGTEGAWSPWTYVDDAGELVGFDVEIAKAIAEKLGVEAKFEIVEWDGIFAGIDNGRYDFTLNGVDWTEERAEKYSFSEPYAYGKTVLVVKGDNDEITKFEDLDGKTTANSISSTYAATAESYGATNTGVETIGETMELLIAGRIDATINSQESVGDYLKEQPDADIKIVAALEEKNNVVIPFRKNAESESLIQAVNDALAELKADGTLTEISMKYFGVDITSAE